MIISGGVNIYPQEAENVLVTHPKVVDVAVFGVPNDDFGEEVKAVVQPVDDAADAGAARRSSAELIALLPLAPRRRQVPALDRLPRRAPPPPDRQALQAAPQGRVLAGRRPLDLVDPGRGPCEGFGVLGFRWWSRRVVRIVRAGVCQSRVMRGRSLRSAAMSSRSSWVWQDRSVPLGRNWRTSPFQFSLLPRCQGECGSQK